MSEEFPIQSVDTAPICLGCGLISHLVHPAAQPICWECFNRRERRAGGGMWRVVTASGTVHETAACPGVKTSAEWWHMKDEDCMYAEMAGDYERCSRCYSHSFHGFDHYRGEDKTVIGHG